MFRFFWWQPQIFLKELPCFFMVLREVDSQVKYNSLIMAFLATLYKNNLYTSKKANCCKKEMVRI